MDKSGFINNKFGKIPVLIIISVAMFLSITVSRPGLSTTFPAPATLADRLQRIQIFIDRGELSRAGREIEKLKTVTLPVGERALVEAIEGNLAFRIGDRARAIDLYTGAAPFLEGENRQYLELNLALAHLESYRLFNDAVNDRDPAIGLLKSLQNSDNTTVAIRAGLELLHIKPDALSAGDLEARIRSLPSGNEKAVFLAEIAYLSPSPPRTFETSLRTARDGETRLAILLKRARWSLDNRSESLSFSIEAAVAAENTGNELALLTARSLIARSYLKIGRTGEAGRAYSLAVETVGRLRRIHAGNPVPASTLDEIDTTIGEYLKLTLESDSPDLSLATRLIRLSGAIEIDRYFKSICSPAILSPTAGIKTAILYTAALPESFHTIAVLPDGSYLHSASGIGAGDIGRLASNWRASLATRFRDGGKPLGENLYRLILLPFENRLQREGIDRLVFINDRILQNVPMAALWDGKNYLIARYGITYSVGRNGTTKFSLPSPALLVAAYPEAGLPGTTREIDRLKALLNSSEVIEPRFSGGELSRGLNYSRFRLLHLATHSVFGENASGTYVRVGETNLTPGAFQNLLESRNSDLYHITLSSCESARGDKYATLGLSGIALRSGARSVMGTLWPTADLETADFMADFYSFWRESGDPSLALKAAQLRAIATGRTRPAYWAGFIFLIN